MILRQRKLELISLIATGANFFSGALGGGFAGRLGARLWLETLNDAVSDTRSAFRKAAPAMSRFQIIE